MIVGRYSYIGNGEELFNPEIEIGAFSQIGNGYKFYGACEHPSVMRDSKLVPNFPFGDKWQIEKYPKTFSRGKIYIGNDVWLGENVTILDGSTIGDGAIVGANSVISGHVAPYCVVAGNPFENLRNRFSLPTITQLLNIKWWNWTEEQIKSRIDLLMDVDKLIEAYLKNYE